MNKEVPDAWEGNLIFPCKVYDDSEEGLEMVVEVM